MHGFQASLNTIRGLLWRLKYESLKQINAQAGHPLMLQSQETPLAEVEVQEQVEPQ